MKKRSIIIIIALLLVIVGLVTALLLGRRGAPGLEKTGGFLRDPNADVGQVGGKTDEELQEELNRIVEDGMFNISINPTPTFENGAAEGDLRIENVPANRYLMSVQITLADTGEVVYTSGVIEPNHHIQDAKLDVNLPKGVYEAGAQFTAYDPDTEAEAGYAQAVITITVKN